MISMTKQQKEEFNRTRQLLNNANTIEEAKYHSKKLQTLIDTAKAQNPTVKSNFTKEQLTLYREYKDKLRKAKYPGKVRYYRSKIRELLEQVEKAVV